MRGGSSGRLALGLVGSVGLHLLAVGAVAGFASRPAAPSPGPRRAPLRVGLWSAGAKGPSPSAVGQGRASVGPATSPEPLRVGAFTARSRSREVVLEQTRGDDGVGASSARAAAALDGHGAAVATAPQDGNAVALANALGVAPGGEVPTESGAPGSTGAGSTGAGSGQAGGIEGAGSSADLGALHEQLRRSARRCYPAAAQRFRLQGQVKVTFCVGEAGSLASASVATSAGSPLLDRAAVQCVLEGAVPLAAPSGCYTLPVLFGL